MRGSASSSRQRSLFRNSNEDRKKRESAVLRDMEDVTTNYLKRMEDNSDLFDTVATGDEIKNNGAAVADNIIIVPRFQPNEIELETTIGMGEFGLVLKVGTISLNSHPNPNRHIVRQNSNSNNEGGGGSVSVSMSVSAMHDSEAMVANAYAFSSDAAAPVLWISSSSEQNHNCIETDRILREELANTVRRSSSRITTTTSMSTLDTSGSSSATTTMPVATSDVPENNMVLVLKQIRKDLYPKKKIESAKDLAREAKLLARLQQLYFFEERLRSSSEPSRHHYQSNHPNLITLRGIASNPGSPEFGILLDRLHLTMEELVINWGKRQESMLRRYSTARSRKRGIASSLLLLSSLPPVTFPQWMMGSVEGIFHRGENNECAEEEEEGSDNIQTSHRSVGDSTSVNNTTGKTTKASSLEAMTLLAERVLALWDIAEGMSYLHSHRILYRDLKTENIGRSVRSEPHQRMQIFDFGLAKECKSVDQVVPSRSPNSNNSSSSGSSVVGVVVEVSCNDSSNQNFIVVSQCCCCSYYFMPYISFYIIEVKRFMIIFIIIATYNIVTAVIIMLV